MSSPLYPRPTHPGLPEDLEELRRQADLVNLAFDAIFTRGFRDRSIRFWSRGAEELYGWNVEEAEGREPADLLGTHYPEPLDEIEWHLLSTGRWEGELVQTRKDGRQVVVHGRWALARDESGEPDEILEVNADITHRKRAEEELRRSEERFRLLVTEVRDYAIFMLDPQGYVASWNEGARRIKGYEGREIIGRHFAMFYPTDDIIAGKPTRELQVARAEGRFEDEGWRLRKDGGRFWASIAISALRDRTGFLHGYAMVTRDLTKQKEQQDKLLEYERSEAARLRRHAERMAALEEAKSQFLNLASHELRGPLAVIGGYLSLMQDGSLGELNPLGKQSLPVLAAKVSEMNRLIDQMIELARLEEGKVALKVETFDLGGLVREVVADLSAARPQSLDITLELPMTVVEIEGDVGRVRTIVANILDNAIKYSPDGGPIKCTVRQHDDIADVEVQDSGLGIATTDMDRLFTRFGRIVTRDNSHIPGTGLGLYLCRELARMQGGDIVATSTEGVGSTFTLTLPLKPRPETT